MKTTIMTGSAKRSGSIKLNGPVPANILHVATGVVERGHQSAPTYIGRNAAAQRPKKIEVATAIILPDKIFATTIVAKNPKAKPALVNHNVFSESSLLVFASKS